jgi:hypothetical protein
MGIEVPKQPIFVFMAEGDRRKDLGAFAETIANRFGMEEASGLIEGRYIDGNPGHTLVFIDAKCTEWRAFMRRLPGWTQL